MTQREGSPATESGDTACVTGAARMALPLKGTYVIAVDTKGR
jgi:hypothetical protein